MKRLTLLIAAAFAVAGCATVKEKLSPEAPAAESQAEVKEAEDAAASVPLPEEPMRRAGIAYEMWFPPQAWDKAWDRPELGTYESSDERVIRQHAEWLTDAGVDFVWIDWSNNSGAEDIPSLKAIETATEKLFAIYAGMEKAPQISIFLGLANDPGNIGNGALQRKADQLYEQFVKRPEYARLLVHYQGRPLLVIYAGAPSPWTEEAPPWDDERFTVRWMTSFLEDQPELQSEGGSSKLGYWSWWERYPQVYALRGGIAESVAVTAAYPGPEGWPMPGTRGREEGATFREQWARAREVDPRFVLINSWNEWIPPEEVNVEFSNDLEPSEAYGRQYVDALKEEIATWKALPARSRER